MSFHAPAAAAPEHILLRAPGMNFMEGVSPGIGIPDHARALLQHHDLGDALARCGVSISSVATDPAFPDGCFIGDMAVVTDTLAVVANLPESSPRQGEQKAVASWLAPTHFLKFITAPGYLDASDVLRIDNRFYIGLSPHTNQEGAAQLAFFLREFGYEADVLDLSASAPLRLRSAAVSLHGNRVLIREEISRHYAFLSFEKIVIPAAEARAGGSLMAGGTLLMAQGCPGAAARVRSAGIPVIELNVSEFEKMNGGLSCLALEIPPRSGDGIIYLDARRDRQAA